jgi:hypothetical protein
VYLKANGTRVILVLIPFHPIMFEDLKSHPEFRQVLLEESYFREFAREQGISLLGAYDPGAVGCSGTEFFDGLHPIESCISRVLRSKWCDGPAESGEAALDQCTRRIAGFGVHRGVVDGVTLCQMFNRAIGRQAAPTSMNSSMPYLAVKAFRFDRLHANPRQRATPDGAHPDKR